jgi:hypothetical protein
MICYLTLTAVDTPLAVEAVVANLPTKLCSFTHDWRKSWGPKRRTKYQDTLAQLLTIASDIETLYPDLSRLFVKDSVHFGKTVTLREA